MKLLFICKYNAFRSRIAEEYFKKINSNPKIKAISRGLIYGGKADIIQQKLAKKLLNINIYKRKSMQVSLNELIEADKIIVVANDIPKRIFDYQKANLQKKLVIWNIKDEQLGSKKNIKNIILKIKKRVEKLNKNLTKK